MVTGKTVVAVVCVGAFASFAAFVLVQRLEEGRAQAEFARESASLTMVLQRAKETNLAQLDNLAGLYRASKSVDADEFEAFVAGLHLRNPSIKAFEWIQRVGGEQRAEFEKTLTITEKRNGRIVASFPKSEYFPVCYVEPREGNSAALGFDLASEAARHEALKQAAESGVQTATRPIELVQNESDSSGFVVVNPIYRHGGQKATLADREDGLIGYVAGVFQYSVFVEKAFMNRLPEWVGVGIKDVTDPDDPVEVFALNATGTSLESGARTHRIQVAGRNWDLRFVPQQEHFLATRIPPPWSILVAGLAMTTLLGISLSSAVRHASRSRAAEKQTLEALRAREAAFEEASLLGSITEKINAGHGIGEILDFVYEAFESIIPYDRIGLALVEDGGKTVHSRWSRTRHDVPKLGDGYCAPLEGSSLKKVLESGLPRILDDLPTYARTHPDSTSSHLIVEEGMRSSLTCPLVVRGKAVGFLFFSSTAPGTYKVVHVETFMRVARQLSVIVEKGQLFDALAEEEQRSERILRSLLPREILGRVKNGEKVIADEIPSVSVVFADLVGFSEWSRRLSSSELVILLNRIFQRFDRLALKWGMVKIGAQGDGYLAVAGLPAPLPDHARMAADFALDLRRATAKFRGPDQHSLALRIGIHSGPVVAGVLGQFARRYDVWGRTVNFASRMESQCDPGRIQVSAETASLLQSHFRLTQRSPINAKGFGRIQTYWLEDASIPMVAREA
jgi:class 3 adenylate cyclase/CHASE1-domain containing sensor protein